MKAIKICHANASKIEAVLQSVNGLASTHTFTWLLDIERLAQNAEAALTDLGLTKLERPGAILWVTSGEPLPSAYKYGRVVSSVKLERKVKDWFLTSVAAGTGYREPGKRTLCLTTAQDAAAVAHLRRGYSVT